MTMIAPGTEIANPRTGQRMRFVQTGRESGGAILEIDCFSPPRPRARAGARSPPTAEHLRGAQRGALRFRVDGAERVGPGERVVIPPGVPHYFWVDGNQEAHYRQEFRPALNIAAFFETYFGLVRDNRLDNSGRPNLLLLAVLGQTFRDEIYVTQPPPWVQLILYGVVAPVARLIGYRPTAA